MLAGRLLRYAACMDVIEVMTALLTAEDEGQPPPKVGVADAIAISAHFHAEADRGNAAIAEVAKNLGATIYCAQGCNGCCHDMVMVRGPEAVEVASWLALPEHTEARELFLANYPSWRGAVGNAPERLAELFASGVQEAFEAAHREVAAKAVLCAFNHGGACLIYDVRPMACRANHAVGTAAHCQPGATTPPTRVVFVPMDNLVALSRRVLRAADRAALGPTAVPEALCKTVAAVLHTRT